MKHGLVFRSSSESNPIFRCLCGRIFLSNKEFDQHIREERQPPSPNREIKDLSIYGDATDAASESDRKWFEEHPGQVWRVRRLFPLEFVLAPGFPDRRKYSLTYETSRGLCVAVRQIEPGRRVRLTVPIQPEFVDLKTGRPIAGPPLIPDRMDEMPPPLPPGLVSILEIHWKEVGAQSVLVGTSVPLSELLGDANEGGGGRT